MPQTLYRARQADDGGLHQIGVEGADLCQQRRELHVVRLGPSRRLVVGDRIRKHSLGRLFRGQYLRDVVGPHFEPGGAGQGSPGDDAIPAVVQVPDDDVLGLAVLPEEARSAAICCCGYAL